MPAPIDALNVGEHLAKHKNKAMPVILLLGDEAYLRDLCRDQIIETFVDRAARDWGVRRFSAGTDDFGEVLGQARTVPMLASRQAIIVGSIEELERLGDKQRETVVKELKEYIADPPPFTVLVLEAAALDQRMTLGKALADGALVVATELPSDPADRLAAAAGFAAHLARENGAALEPGAAEDLADLCNMNLASIRSEIAKLATYAGPGQTIRRADIAALVASEKKYSVWQLADMLAARDRRRALIFLDSLLREGEPPPAIIGAMAWMYRRLLEAQELGPHVSAGQAAGKLKMRFDSVEIALRSARKIPRKRLVEGLQALYDADSRLKSGAADRVVMEFLIAKLIGENAAAAKG